MHSEHYGNRKKFAISLAVLQIIIFTMYGVFVRPQVHNDANKNLSYTFYQDINVMMLMGFGFLMTFARKYAWSALSYTFFINSLVVQLYILVSQFWKRIFEGHWVDYEIFINEKTFIAASYSVASVLIAFGAVLGRVGPLELLIMSIVQVFGYALNQHIVYDVIKMYDAGGSSTIHTFGAYFGLTVSFILGRQVVPLKKPQITYISNIFALIGTFFLWMFWPSFNAGYFAQTPYEKTVIITNTILALTGSNLACFVMTALLQQKFFIDHIQNATLAGGVIIGASSGIFTNSGASLILGAFGGIIACLGYSYGQQRFRRWFGLYDSAGVQHLHGVPGMLGAGLSAISIGVYQLDPINDPTQESYLNFYSNTFNGRTFIGQSGIQVAGSFISFGMAILFGIIAGLLIRPFYSATYLPVQFYDDHFNFQDAELLKQVGPRTLQDIEIPNEIHLRTNQNLNRQFSQQN